MRAAVVLLCCGLAACQTAPLPAVNIKVPVPCVKEKPVRPALVTEAELKAMNDYQYVLALSRHRLQSEAYIGELESVIDGCAQLSRPD